MVHVLKTEEQLAARQATVLLSSRDPERSSERGGGWRQGATALLVYAAVSFAFWGVHVVFHLGSMYVSNANVGDERFYTWAFAWWPHAIAHGLNPFHANVVWAPHGVSMAWVTGLPGPALLFEPLTALAGPIVSVNVLFVLAPALAGWAAYLVCRRVTRSFWPALAGGYVFGFSTYVIDQMRGHLNLVLIFPVPLALYLVLRRLDGDLRRRTFVALLAADLLVQFSISTEVFATMALVGGCCLIGAVVFGGPAARRAVLPAAAEMGAALAVALLVSAPYIVATFHQQPAEVAWPAYRGYLARYSSDLAGTVIPRNFTAVGGHLVDRTSSRFVTSRAEDGSYFGIPLLVLFLLAAATRWRERTTWLLTGAFVFVVTLSCGPVLHVVGHPSVWLPWSLFARIPGLGQALPSRLSMFAWLIAAIVVARWLAGRRAEPRVPNRASQPEGPAAARRRTGPARPWATLWTTARWGMVALVVVSIFPRVPPAGTPAVPRLFADGAYRRYLQPGEIVLTLPFSTPDLEMLWQVEAGFSFRLAGGYVGARPIPAGERDQRAFHGLFWDRPWRIPAPALRAYLVEHQVGAVILDPSVPHEWQRLLAQLGLVRRSAGGLVLYQVPPNFAIASA